MAKVTSKRQVTIPKEIADRYGIEPGDELSFVPAGEAIRVEAGQPAEGRLDTSRRLELFDAATARQRARQRRRAGKPPGERGWTRAELYTRGRAD